MASPRIERNTAMSIKQAIEALEGVIRVADRATVEFDNARAALAALRSMPQGEPVAWGMRLKMTGEIYDCITPGEHEDNPGEYTVPLYATPHTAPVPAEPVAHLWQHGETGRTRVVMPDEIFTAAAAWHVVGPLYLGTAP